MSLDVKFVDTLSGINVSNGVVKLYFVSQDDNDKNARQQSQSPKDMQPTQTIVMPIAGFMYMVSIVKGLLETPQMIEQIQRYIDAGLLPTSVKEDAVSVSTSTQQPNLKPLTE